ncbi:MAG: hypothetical protein C0392_02165 [Syntrophus sp. (in: bacteria)]|nr:hypothetical protein [Syntrophus sp. (in: bacteria)]
MNSSGKTGCGCLIFILVCCLVAAGLLAHPISLKFLGNQFRYEDKVFPSEAIFIPRFHEDRNGELYIDAFREYWAGNGKTIYAEDDKMFGASILEPIQKMAKARNIKEEAVKKIETGGDGITATLNVKKQFAAMGYRKVIILVPEYASRRFHLLYEGSGDGGKTIYLIKPVNVSYFKKDRWWKDGPSRLLLLKELYSMGSNAADRFKHGEKKE